LLATIRGLFYIDEILAVSPVDNVEVAATAGGGE
jgi:hypothetical protein